MTRYMRAFALPTAAIAALTLAACGSSSSPVGPAASPSAANSSGTVPATSTTPMASDMPGMTSPSGTAVSAHNAADVTFVTEMIPHHGQAIEMAKLAATRAVSPDVKALALKIEAAQQPEIAEMSGWLKAWGMPVPSVTMDGGSMADMDMGAGTGMMSADDMTKLHAASGTAFDKAFLTGMISHHAGAIAMAAAEVTSGESADAITLAKAIQSDQAAEIAQMQALLKK